MTHIRIQSHLRADPQTVWARISDHEGMPAWSPLTRVTLRPGDPTPNGVGAVRRMYLGRLIPPIVEEVIGWEEGVSFSYAVRGGAPIRDHHGQITVAPEGQGSQVTWEVRFTPVVPGTGWLIGGALRRTLGGMLKRLDAMLSP